MKLFSFFVKMFSSKKPVDLPVTIEEEFVSVVEEQPVVIILEEEVLQPKKKKAVKKGSKIPTLK